MITGRLSRPDPIRPQFSSNATEKGPKAAEKGYFHRFADASGEVILGNCYSKTCQDRSIQHADAES